MDIIFLNTDGTFKISGLIDFLLTIFILTAINILFYFFVKRKVPFYSTLGISFGIILFSIFNLNYAVLVLIACLVISLVIYLFANLAEARTIIANKYVGPKKIRQTTKEIITENSYNKDSLYKTVNEAILYLSKHKIGAIVTFERKDNLSNLLKNGSILNAPVTYELLITIFYPGTRLHDGAVVIRNNQIIAASVYYTPTTKPLIGKYGSRHRAAIGISEICDAVTVVVSEETGRISIAYNGELTSYNPDSFYTGFENIMAETEPRASSTEDN